MTGKNVRETTKGRMIRELEAPDAVAPVLDAQIEEVRAICGNRPVAVTGSVVSWSAWRHREVKDVDLKVTPEGMEKVKGHYGGTGGVRVERRGPMDVEVVSGERGGVEWDVTALEDPEGYLPVEGRWGGRVLVPVHAENLGSKWLRRGHLLEPRDVYDLAICAVMDPQAFGEVCGYAERKAGKQWLEATVRDLGEGPSLKGRRTRGALDVEAEREKGRVLREMVKAWLRSTEPFDKGPPEEPPEKAGRSEVRMFLEWCRTQRYVGLGREPDKAEQGAYRLQRGLTKGEEDALLASWERVVESGEG